MTDDGNLTYFEKRILAEIHRVEQQIAQLESEKRFLQKQLSKARADRTGLRSVTRKNSLNRVLAESSVIEMLRVKGRPVSTKELFRNAQATNFDLKEATFRSYLHRMKNRAEIKGGRHVGTWELPDQE